MSAARKFISSLGAVTLAAWLCAAAPAQVRSAGNQKTTVASDELATLAPEVVDPRAQGHGYGDGCCACDACCCDSCCDCCCDSCCGGHFYAGYGNVWLKPHFDRDIAVIDDNNPNNGQTVYSFDWDLEYSPRVWVGYATDCGSGLRVSYWEFDHQARFSRTEDAATENLQLNFDTDDVAISLNVDGTINAVHSVEVHVLDFEGTEQVRVGQIDLTVSAGARWVRLEQEFFASETGGTETFHFFHDFDGVGPTFAIEASRPFLWSSLRLFANSRGSFLFGDGQTTGEDDGALVYVFTNHSRLLSIFECQVGAEYAMCLGSGTKLSVRAAMEGQLWVNGGTGFASREDDGGSVDPADVNMGFFGFVVSGSVAY